MNRIVDETLSKTENVGISKMENGAGDTISRQAAIDKIDERQRKLIYCFGFENDAVKIMDIAKSIITAIPSVQPKHGEWEYHSNPWIGINPETAYCSCCGLRVDTTGDIDFDEYNFCPRCGADMRTKETDCDYERAVEQLEHDMLYEPTFNPDDGSM